jgi:2Fe-2S ferredoxin
MTAKTPLNTQLYSPLALLENEMINITFITPSGEQIAVEAVAGVTVMEAAVAANVDGIDAECGGACSCATCHVKLNTEGFKLVGEAGELEASMLEFANESDEFSRLSCQLKVSDAYEGIVFTVVA